MVSYAHSDKEKDRSQWQLSKAHLENTEAGAAEFGKIFGAEKLAYVVWLLHDVGRYYGAFQKSLEGKPLRVDHCTLGADESSKSSVRLPNVSKI